MGLTLGQTSVCGFPVPELRRTADAEGLAPTHPVLMFRKSYAIYWTEGEGPRHTGKVQLGRLHVLLKGGRGARLAVAREEIESINYLGREIVIRRRNKPSVTIGSLDSPGALLELLELTTGVGA